MKSKFRILQNLIDNIKDNLTSIQKERSKLNDTKLPLKTKKRISDENFHKIIKLKNDDINAVLAIKNEMLELDEGNGDDGRQLSPYNIFGIDDKIANMYKLFDETFSVVDMMKRQTEYMLNEGEAGTSSHESFSIEDEIKTMANKGNVN